MHITRSRFSKVLLGTLLTGILVVIQSGVFFSALGINADFGPQAGFPHGEGITHDTPEDCTPGTGRCPDGLSFPSFNNFTDNNSNTFPDERRFLVAKIATASSYSDTVAFTVGNDEEIKVAAYFHNTADPDLNSGAGTGIARNVRTFADMFQYNAATGKYETAVMSGNENLTQTISASNTNPAAVTDTVTFDPSNGDDYYLELVDNSLCYVKGNRGTCGTQGVDTDYLDPAQFFGSGDAIGNPVLGSGDYYGCEDFRGLTYFNVIVRRASVVTVGELTIEKQVNLNNADDIATAQQVSDGATLAYQITVGAPTTNTVTVQGIQLTDTVTTLAPIIGSITNVQLCVNGTPCQSLANLNSIPTFDLDPGHSATLSYDAIADYNVAGDSAPQLNTARAVATSPAQTLTDPAYVIVRGQAPANDVSELRITKVANPASPNPLTNFPNGPNAPQAIGDYTVTVENVIVSGNGQTATNAVVTEGFGQPTNGGRAEGFNNSFNIPTGGTFPNNTFTIPSIAPGATYQLSYQVIFDRSLPTPIPAGQFSDITNAVTITNGGGVNIGTPSVASATVRMPAVSAGPTPTSALTITKSVVQAQGTSVNTNAQDTGTATYTIRVINTATVGAGQTATNVTVSDVFANPTNGGSVTSISNLTGATQSGTLPNLTFTIASIAPGATATITFDAAFTRLTPTAVPNAANSDITNTATITNNGGTTTGNPLSATATVRIVGAGIVPPCTATYTVEKTVQNANADTAATAVTVPDGTSVLYEVTVTALASNTCDLEDVDIIDTVLTLVPVVSNISNIQLAINGSAPVPYAAFSNIPRFNLPPSRAATLSYRADTDFNTAGACSSAQQNTATITASNAASVSDNANLIVCGPTAGTLTIDKSVTPGSRTITTAATTTTADYTIVVNNTSGATAANVTVRDLFANPTNGGSVTAISNLVGATQSGTLPDVTFTIASIAPNTVATISFTVTFSTNGANSIPEDQQSCFANTASITAGGGVPLGTPSSDNAQFCITVDRNGTPNGVSALSIDKAVTPTTVTTNANTVTADYTIRVTNTITTAPGATATNVRVDDVFAAFTNSGTVTSISNVVGATTSGTQPNLAFTIASIAPGATATVTFTATFDIAAVASGAQSCVTNTATIGNNGGTTTGTPSSDTAQTCVTRGTAAGANFIIDKSVSDTTVDDGDRITYTIIIQNTGAAAGNISVTDTIGASNNGFINGDNDGRITYVANSQTVTGLTGGATSTGTINTSAGVTLTNVPAGGAVTISYQVDVDDNGVAAGDTTRFVNIALLSNTRSDSVTVRLAPDDSDDQLDIEKSVRPRIVRDGERAEYTITIENRGTSTLDFDLTDTISRRSGTLFGQNGGSVTFVPGSLRVRGISSRDWSGSIDRRGGLEFENVEPGDEITITYDVIANAQGVNSGFSSEVENTAELSTGEEDDASLLIQGQDDIIVVLPPIDPQGGFSITKSASVSSARDGDIVTYTVQVNNHGDMIGVVGVLDSLSQGGVITGPNGGAIEYVPGSTRVSGAQYQGDVVQGLTLANLMPGQSAIVTYEGRVNASQVVACGASPVTNTVLLTTGNGASTTVEVNAPACRSLPPRTPSTGSLPMIPLASMGIGGIASLAFRLIRRARGM